MTELKTIYQRLQPSLKKELTKNAKKYNTAKRLKYKLMSSTLWHELTVNEISSIISFASMYSYELTASDIIHGSEKFLKNRY